jgi:hypothetical protein
MLNIRAGPPTTRRDGGSGASSGASVPTEPSESGASASGPSRSGEDRADTVLERELFMAPPPAACVEDQLKTGIRFKFNF